MLAAQTVTGLSPIITNRFHFVALRKYKSSTHAASDGVPQGSVLTPLSIGQLIYHHGLYFHVYADVDSPKLPLPCHALLISSTHDGHWMYSWIL